MHVLLNLSHCLKSYGHFCQILLFSFHGARSPNMVMSSDPRCKVRNFLFCLNSVCNQLRKVTKFLVERLFTFRSYQPKPHGGPVCVCVGGGGGG